MKFMVEYSIRPGSSCDETAENLKKLLNAFGGWTQPAGLTIHAFVGKVEAMAGYVLCEADDPKVLAGWAAQYMSWNDVRFIPVIDVEDGVEAYAAGLNWFSSATN